MKIYVIEYGNIYDGIEIYQEAYTDVELANVRRLELEETLHKENKTFESQYGAYVTEIELI